MRTFPRLLSYAFSLVTVSAAAAVLPAPAPRTVVGTVLSDGPFELAHTASSGTATVLSGDEVKTNGVESRILLKGGSELHLAPHSTGNFYSDHAELLSGTLSFRSSPSFYVASQTFRIAADSPGSQANAIVQLNGSTVTVNALSGTTRVASLTGETVARIPAGTTLTFNHLNTDPAEPAALSAADQNVNRSNTTVRLLGVLDSENGHFLVRDRFTNSVSEVKGSQVDAKLVNHLVMVDGTWMGNEHSTISQVDRVVQVSKLAPSDATGGVPCLADGASAVAKLINLSGVVSKVRNHFLLADAKKGTYEIVGDVDDKEIGSDVHARGFIMPKRATILPAEQVVYVEHRNLAVFASPCIGAIVGSTLIGSGIAAFPRNDAAVTGKGLTAVSY